MHATKPAARYLLCRPAGGLNDMLCQIGKCAAYAEKHGRVLVVHTGTVEFGIGLETYFMPLVPEIVFATPELLGALAGLDAYPNALQGRVNSYAARYSGERRNFVLDGSGEPISFDFAREHAEPLLVHHACGGGLLSLEALKRLRLKPDMVENFQARMRIVGKNYAGVHVRHTDYRTDYPGLFAAVAESLPQGRIVVCTDNREVLDYARALFGARVYNFADLPDTGGQPLHYGNGLDLRTVNRDSILDLVTLARASRLYLARVSQGHYSGFSRLAAALNQNQPLVDRLLGRTPT